MIELKIATGRKIKLSPHQVAFHVKHAQQGCPVFILVESKDDLLLYRGAQAIELLEKGTETAPVAFFPGPKVMWSSLEKKLSEGL